MNNVLFAKCEDAAPELFGEEWKDFFQVLLEDIISSESCVDQRWDVLYHALVPGKDGAMVPAPWAFETERARESWAIKARMKLSEWAGVECVGTRIDWVEGQGWKVNTY